VQHIWPRANFDAVRDKQRRHCVTAWTKWSAAGVKRTSSLSPSCPISSACSVMSNPATRLRSDRVAWPGRGAPHLRGSCRTLRCSPGVQHMLFITAATPPSRFGQEREAGVRTKPRASRNTKVPRDGTGLWAPRPRVAASHRPDRPSCLHRGARCRRQQVCRGQRPLFRFAQRAAGRFLLQKHS
jgi:hypothetical protein